MYLLMEAVELEHGRLRQLNLGIVLADLARGHQNSKSCAQEP